MQKLIPTGLQLQQYLTNVWAVRPKHGEQLKDILKPEYWANVASLLKEGDLISLYWEDNSLFVELIVTARAKMAATVKLIREVKLNETVKAETTEEYSVVWKQAKRFCIIRTSDNEIVEEGIASKAEAIEKMGKL